MGGPSFPGDSFRLKWTKCDESNTKKYASATQGQEDETGNEIDIAGIDYWITPWIFPSAGILDSMGMYAQGNAGSGVSDAVNLIWEVWTVEPEITAVANKAMMKLQTLLHSAVGEDTILNDVADSTIFLAHAGQNIAVPREFVIVVKAGFTGTAFKVRGCTPGLGVPGLPGDRNAAGNRATAAFKTGIGVVDPPVGLSAGSSISISSGTFPLSTMCAWKAP